VLIPLLRLPTTENGLYGWTLILTVAYIVAAYLVRAVYLLRKKKGLRPSAQFFASKLFDGVTFSGALMLLGGVFSPPLLVLIGSTKPFLIIASLAGIGYSIHALFPED